MKKIMYSLLACCASVFSGQNDVALELRQKADQAYQNVDLMPANEHGWFGPSNKAYLNKFLEEKKVNVVIEVGSWLGLSTAFMANRLPEGATLYAVDHFEGDWAINAHAEYQELLPSLYEQFLSNMLHAGVDTKVVPIKATTEEAFHVLKGHVKADLIYIDAAHDTESVYKDIVMYSQLLSEEGILTGDDWTWPSVQAAVERYASEHGKQIGAEGNFWYYY